MTNIAPSKPLCADHRRVWNQIWMIMRLTIVLIIISTFTLSAKSYSQKVDLFLKNSPIETAFEQIRQQTGYSFFWKEQTLESLSSITVSLRKASLQEAVKACLKDLPLTFKIQGNIVYIERSEVSPSQADPNIKTRLSALPAITGKVTDAKGAPLAGVSVIIKGTKQGTVTDADGRFVLPNVPDDAILRFSFIGMKPEEVSAAGKEIINVIMTKESVGLDEIVAIGYATRAKGSITGAISSVDKRIFENRPMTNTLSALQGALPGVTVLRGNGRPGNDNYTLQIRGISSINGNKPLILIDGIPGDLNILNPNDILSVSVLKDAAASIYGARAADGVVLVTTKKGSRGKPSISYTGNFGVKVPDFLKRMANTSQLVEMYDEGMKNINGVRVPAEVFDKVKANAEPDPVGWLWPTDPGFYQNTDWTKEVFGTGIQQMHNVSITGGGENSSYLFSAGYNREEGIMKYGKDVSKVYNLRMNYDFKIFNWLSVETRNSFDQRSISEPFALASVLAATPRIWSFIPIYNTVGQFYQFRGWGNPIRALVEGGDSKNNLSKFSTNVKAEARITKDLKVITQMGITLGYNDASTAVPTSSLYDWYGNFINYNNSPNSASYLNSKNYYGLYNAYLEYSKALLGKHKLNAMVGASQEENRYASQSVGGKNFTSNELFTLNLADKTKAEYISLDGSSTQWTLKSYFARLSYDYEKKYFVDLTLRMDGSSKFAPQKRWSSFFPAASVAWNLSEENFIRSAGIFDNLKLRGSWGQTGNQDLSFGNYDYIPLVTLTGTYPFGSPNVGQTSAISSIASASRTWETIEAANVGLDFAFLQSRLTGSFDYFTKMNNKMLVNIQLPALLGGAAPTQNQGKLRTNGWDLSLGWQDNIGQFKYSVTAIVSDNKNKLIELGGNDTYAEGLVKLRQGYSLNSYFGYVDDGIIQNDKQLTEYKKLGNIPAKIGIGDMMYRDVDGDGKITAFGDPLLGTQGDMVYLGNLMPRYTYSSNINLSYKNFDLSIFLQGVGKRQGVRTGEFAAPFAVWFYQPLEYFYGKTWSADRPDAPYPQIIPGNKGADELLNWDWRRVSERRIVNLAYLRAKVLTLAYNLPETSCRKLKMQHVRIYVSGQDLFTFSKGTWGRSFDPEETWERSDEQTYPFTKVISAGLDVKF